MNSYMYIAGGVFALISAIILFYPAFLYIFLFLLYSVILVGIAVFGTIYVHFIMSSRHQSQTTHQPSNVLYSATCAPMFDLPKPINNTTHLPIIFGRTVDGVLLQIIDFSFRDLIMPWLSYVVRKPKNLSDTLREDIWMGIQKLKERAVKIDVLKMIAVDMTVRVTIHLEKLRIANARATESGKTPIFATTSYLASDEKELEFLRKLCEIMVIFLMPRGYSLLPMKNLLSEVLSYKIFHPMINLLTSPDYINQKIVQFIESRLATAAMLQHSYEYAASFEDFLKVIASTNTIDELASIRSSIVNDIMQATTQQNIQRSKGLDPDSEQSTFTKSEIAAAVKLKRYIQQLSYAKAQCEKNLMKLGWKGGFANDLNLSMVDILSTVVGRRYFTLFLEPLQASGLVGFYKSVEELKHSNKSAYHQLGAEIFYTYIRAPSSPIKIDKAVRKKMESFMLGDMGPDIFYDVQKTVLRTLEEKYYSSFLLSEYYQELKDSLASDDVITIGSFNDIPDDTNCNANDNEASVDLNNHSTYARNKLEQLQEKLDNKSQALDALKSSLKPESKLLSILDKEVDWLKMEKRQLEAHLIRTEVWAEHLGRWRAIVQSVEVPDEKEPPQFMILVEVEENLSHTNDNLNADHGSVNEKSEMDNISTGWVVLRSLTEFHELHRKLRPLCPDLRNVDLPSTAFKIFFIKSDKSSLEKAKGQIQKYLNFILEEDFLNQSEAIYTFLSPSSENLKQSTPSPKKTKFSLSTLFKTSTTESTRSDPFWGPCGQREGEEDISLFLQGVVSENDNAKSQSDVDLKDSIAEPLYALMDEVFDMGGVFKWLRRKLISFVQITYGRTINRQIRESINYLFEEPMLHYYTSTLSKSFWPGGVLASSYPARTQDMQEQTANAARSLLINNIPEVMCNLVGAETAKHGATKVFETVQNATYNKQLFYELLEIVMIELFPEIRQLKTVTKPLTNNK
ncbi:sorting nexin-25 isoform X2 [Bradysia coprophila]|uniref:sorting nexin-25 isoform X2 n=1 Tax=Bradysia coprophila TaxID=38358 RepID=UPI00187DC559|nr:sorting nexin-25 isoform X2 [Bradysia coprophila]